MVGKIDPQALITQRSMVYLVPLLYRWDDDNITDTLSPWDMEPLPDSEGQ